MSQTTLHHLTIMTFEHKESTKKNIAELISDFQNARPRSRVFQS